MFFNIVPLVLSIQINISFYLKYISQKCLSVLNMQVKTHTTVKQIQNIYTSLGIDTQTQIPFIPFSGWDQVQPRLAEE